MKTIRYAILALLMTPSVGVAGVGALSLKVISLDPTVKSGSKIMIQVTTTNVSHHAITYDNINLCDYSVRVLTSTGAPIPETPFKKQMDCSGGGLRGTGRDIVVTLKPAESDSEQILITDQYDMSAPGQYSVHVDRTYPGIGRFSSNIARIKVTQ